MSSHTVGRYPGLQHAAAVARCHAAAYPASAVASPTPARVDASTGQPRVRAKPCPAEQAAVLVVHGASGMDRLTHGFQIGARVVDSVRDFALHQRGLALQRVRFAQPLLLLRRSTFRCTAMPPLALTRSHTTPHHTTHRTPHTTHHTTTIHTTPYTQVSQAGLTHGLRRAGLTPPTIQALHTRAPTSVRFPSGCDRGVAEAWCAP